MKRFLVMLVIYILLFISVVGILLVEDMWKEAGYLIVFSLLFQTMCKIYYAKDKKETGARK